MYVDLCRVVLSVTDLFRICVCSCQIVSICVDVFRTCVELVHNLYRLLSNLSRACVDLCPNDVDLCCTCVELVAFHFIQFQYVKSVLII